MSPKTCHLIVIASFCAFFAYHTLDGQPVHKHPPEKSPRQLLAHSPQIKSLHAQYSSCSNEQVFYHNGRLTGKLIYWNNQPSERTLFEYLDEFSRYSVQTLVYQGQKLSLMRRDLFQIAAPKGSPDQKIETWYYNFDKDKANSLRQVDTYYPNSAMVKERDLFDESGALKASALFEYDALDGDPQYDADDALPGLTRMTLVDDEGRTVLDYKERAGLDIETLYQDLKLPEPEIRRRMAISRDNHRMAVLIMDGGIDQTHPALAYKLWRNAGETLNGRDDDGNGLVDDLFGVSDNPRLHQPIHDLRLPRFGFPSFSHGTLVASVAVQGREDAALMAASELTVRNSDRIIGLTEQFILAHKVRFANMSFVLDRQLIGFEGYADRPTQIKKLIEHTPETLYVVAAGNGAPLTGVGFNMDRLRKTEDLVPAMLTCPNILVVGALDATELIYADYPSYRVAEFSNTGEVSVDILAPGTGICGAQMGGGTICRDGTSFAAPYALNHGVLEVAAANPRLDIYQLKELIIKSAYIPSLEHPLAVSSGGILHPRRAVAAARRLATHPGLTVEEAVLDTRKAELGPIAGEGRDDEYLQALKRFWTQRGIGDSDAWRAESLQASRLSMNAN